MIWTPSDRGVVHKRFVCCALTILYIICNMVGKTASKLIQCNLQFTQLSYSHIMAMRVFN